MYPTVWNWIWGYLVDSRFLMVHSQIVRGITRDGNVNKYTFYNSTTERAGYSSTPTVMNTTNTLWWHIKLYNDPRTTSVM